MPLAYALTTKTKVKTFLGITTVTDDSLIEMICDWVTVWIENQCGERRFLDTTYTDEVYGTHWGQVDVMLNNFPITDTEPFVAEYQAGSISSPNWIAYDVDDYLVYPKQGIVHFFSIFDDVAQAIRFTYSAGYDSIPPDLEMLATELVSKIYKLRCAQGVESQSVEGFSLNFNKDLTPEQKATLAKYQRKLVGQML